MSTNIYGDKLIWAIQVATEAFVDTLLEHLDIEEKQYELLELAIWDGLGYRIDLNRSEEFKRDAEFDIQINRLHDLVALLEEREQA